MVSTSARILIADDLLLPAGELRRIQVLLRNDAEPVENVGDDALAFGLRDITVGERQLDVLKKQQPSTSLRREKLIRSEMTN